MALALPACTRVRCAAFFGLPGSFWWWRPGKAGHSTQGEVEATLGKAGREHKVRRILLVRHVAVVAVADAEFFETFVPAFASL
jgi:hypothetical protein